MIRLSYFTRLAFQGLRRGGQRVGAALLCIAFGIMALVAMNMVAGSIKSAVQVSPAELLGGDMSIGRKAENMLRPQDQDQLENLVQNGEISRFTQIAFHSSLMFKRPGSGEMHFIATALGIEPQNYPLAGRLALMDSNARLSEVLKQTGDVVVTRDVAENYQLQVGTAVILADLDTGIPVEGVVRGIALDTPNHQGDKIYYSLETASRLSGGQPVVNTVMANTNQPRQLKSDLESSGWGVEWAAGRGEDRAANVWVLGLRGAGLLGLLVGGIGIAHTMRVLLRRREKEIAIWKTLGYQTGDLRMVFLLEAGLMGLAGSLPGAGLGVLCSTGLLELFRHTSSLLYQWTFSPAPPLLGVLVGTLSTLVFAAWAIIVSSQARPAALLRNERVEVQPLAGMQAAALGLLLAVPFVLLAALVMESLLGAIGALLGIGLGLGLLGAVFSGLLWVGARVLPLKAFPLARMAVQNLRRSGMALVFATIALFVGVVSMSLGLAVMQKTPHGSEGLEDAQGYNLTILASAGQAERVRQAVEAVTPLQTALGYRTVVKSVQTSSGEMVSQLEQVLVGRTDPADYRLSGADWGSQPGGVYAYKYSGLKAGSAVSVIFQDGTRKSFPVVGTYEPNLGSMLLYPPTGLLIDEKSFLQSAPEDSISVFIQVPSGQLEQAADALGRSLPQATVINLVAYAGRFMRSYQSLYLLPMALAGLALLGGLLLVANSVSLAMLDRRYDVGVFKAIGYSRRQILTIFAVEYGSTGLLATLTGVILVQALLAAAALGARLPASLLLLSPVSLLAIGLAGIGLTLLTVAAASWPATSASPLAVLAERN